MNVYCGHVAMATIVGSHETHVSTENEDFAPLDDFVELRMTVNNGMACYDITITDDSEVEGVEEFVVRVAVDPGFTAGTVVFAPNTTVVRIIDDDSGKSSIECT